MDDFESNNVLEPELAPENNNSLMSRTQVDYMDESLRNNNPELHLKIHRTIKAIYSESTQKGDLGLDDTGHIELTTNQFRGFLAMAVMRGAMVVLVNSSVPNKSDNL